MPAAGKRQRGSAGVAGPLGEELSNALHEMAMAIAPWRGHGCADHGGQAPARAMKAQGMKPGDEAPRMKGAARAASTLQPGPAMAAAVRRRAASADQGNRGFSE